MTSASKAKGNKFERDLVLSAQAVGLTAKRAWGSNGESIGLHATVDLIIENLPVQAKIRKELPKYLQIPESCTTLIMRQDRSEPLVLMRYSEWLEMLLDLKRSVIK